MALSLEQLLSPVPDNPPCGDNKFDDFAYGMTLDADLQDIFGDDDRATQLGEVKEKDDGDWPSFLSKVISYFGLTKHLSLAYYAALADLNLTGLPGLNDGLTLVRLLIARYWEEVWPQLDDGDAEERDDSLMLFNSIDMLNSISAITVASGRQAGTYTLKDSMNSKNSGIPEASLVEAAINETLLDQPEFYTGLKESLAAVRETLGGLKSDLEGSEATFECNFAAFEERLGYIEKFLGEVDSMSGGSPPAEGEAGEDSPEGEATGGGNAPARISGEVTSRADVVKTIDRIIRFYKRQEPSSPVPQLLTRVKRIVDMDFNQIVDEFSLNRQSFDPESIFGNTEENE